jgi:AcrR family transcriptional regulator
MQVQRGDEDYVQTRERVLTIAAREFAEHGYQSVSMRRIAKACEFTPAALYYHFPDKAALYRETLAFVFHEKVSPAIDIVDSSASSEERLRELLRWYGRLVAGDRIFARLLHREMLDGDEERIAFIAKNVFRGPFKKIVELVAEILPGTNAELMTISAFCIVLGHFELESVQRHMIGPSFSAISPEQIADHAVALLLSRSSEDGT